MALHNEILEGRFSRYLTKIFSMKGGAPAPQISSEFQANLQFFTGVEDRALQGWYRYGLAMNLAAGVGQSVAQLRNPAGSTRLVVFEKISVADDGVGGASIWVLATQSAFSDQAGALAIGANTSWDKRLNVATQLVGSLSSGGTAASLIRTQVAFPAAGGNYDFILEEQQEVILSPGESIQIRAVSNAKNLNTSWWWRERSFADSEASA
jgi:hypothetical protein